VEDLLDGRQVRALAQGHSARPLSELMDTMETSEGQERLARYLESTPFPHFEQHPEDECLLIRTDADGKRTVGRFVNRQFVTDNNFPAPVVEFVTPNELAAEFGKSAKAVRDWLRKSPRFQNNSSARYRLRKDDPIIAEAAVRFRKQGSLAARESALPAIGR
jgi:hypothetical protein